MKMIEFVNSCKKRARQLNKEHPNLCYSKRLDLAAKEKGFKHYTSLKNLHKLLGDDQYPSQVAIVGAGGDPDETPYKTLTATVTVSC